MNCERNICYQQEYNGGCDTCPCNRTTEESSEVKITTQEAMETLKFLLSIERHHKEPLRMAIEALEKQLASEWIPCSERLPDKNDTYLITVSSYDETASIEYIAVDHCNSDGGFLHFETKKNPKAKSGKVVTAWMPLPEPYKENK